MRGESVFGVSRRQASRQLSLTLSQPVVLAPVCPEGHSPGVHGTPGRGFDDLADRRAGRRTQRRGVLERLMPESTPGTTCAHRNRRRPESANLRPSIAHTARGSPTWCCPSPASAQWTDSPRLSCPCPRVPGPIRAPS